MNEVMERQTFLQQPVRIESRLRNNILWHLIYDNYPSVVKFCKVHSLSYPTVTNLVNLKSKVRTTKGKYTQTTHKLSAVFNLIPEVVFPDELYGIEQIKAVLEVPLPDSMLEYTDKLALISPEEAYAKKELKEVILTALNTLPERQREIIKYRYGLDGYPMKTLSELGMEQNVTKTVIRMQEMKGLRNLRHSKQKRILSAFIEREMTGRSVMYAEMQKQKNKETYLALMERKNKEIEEQNKEKAKYLDSIIAKYACLREETDG